MTSPVPLLPPPRPGAVDVIDVEAAERTAARLLHHLPERLAHSASAARVAARLADRLGGLVDRDLLTAAAWLHDIGYADDVRATGFHPLDGALHLAREGWPEPVVRLVAHHSHAALVAPYHGLTAHLTLLGERSGLETDVLTYADLTAGPDGSGSTVAERLAGMRRRHAQDDLVPLRARERRYHALMLTGDRIERLAREAAGPTPG